MQLDPVDLDITESPLSESSVSLRLAEIQLRCREFIDDDTALELTLEEPPAPRQHGFDPYDRG